MNKLKKFLYYFLLSIYTATFTVAGMYIMILAILHAQIAVKAFNFGILAL